MRWIMLQQHHPHYCSIKLPYQFTRGQREKEGELRWRWYWNNENYTQLSNFPLRIQKNAWESLNVILLWESKKEHQVGRQASIYEHAYYVSSIVLLFRELSSAGVTDATSSRFQVVRNISHSRLHLQWETHTNDDISHEHLHYYHNYLCFSCCYFYTFSTNTWLDL